MNAGEVAERNLADEFIYTASRSSGPGGQNVNKLNTRVELRFRLHGTLLLSDTEKELIFLKLKRKINKEGELILVAQDGRTQAENRTNVTRRFYEMIADALTEPEKRIPTKPTGKSVARRLDDKKIRGIVKKRRKRDTGSEEL